MEARAGSARRIRTSESHGSFRKIGGTLFWGPLRVPLKDPLRVPLKGLGFRASENWGYLILGSFKGSFKGIYKGSFKGFRV